MTKKLYIIIEDGLVSEILIDHDLAEDVHIEVLNLDEEAPDNDARTQAYIRMISDLYVTQVGHFLPDELV